MLRDLLSNRLFLGSFFVVFMLCLVGLHFWSQHAHRELRESEEETRRFILQLEEKRKATGPHAEQTESGDEEQAEFTANPDTLEDISTTPMEAGELFTEEPEILLETEVDTGVSDKIPDASENTADTAVLEETIQFINTRFATASELYYERLEIRKRRRRVHLPNGISYWTSPPGDKERLNEINLGVYEALSPIGDLVPGAVDVRLRHNGWGDVRCEKYLFPHIFEEVLGEVPEGYYQFDAAMDPFITPPVGQR